MCLMHLLFALPPFYLLPQSAKTELVQVLKGAAALLVPQYKEFFVPDIGKTLFAMKCSFALGSI